jgi:phytoene desaturase
MRQVAGRTDHVIIVGAGLAGLAATLHIIGTGRRVTVIEQSALPGGCAGHLEIDGYRIDTGPTVLTMPELIDEALAAVGESVASRLELVPLHPAYRALFADGSALDVHTDPNAMENAVREFSGAADAAGYRRLRRWLTRIYRAEMHRFIDANFDSPLDLVSPELAKLAALGGFGRLGPTIGRFLRDHRLRRIFSFQSLYAGLDPHRALALYAVISYMDTVHGVWFPRGGMHAVPTAMAEAATRASADFHYGTRVTSLERRGNRVVAVHTSRGERLTADSVVLTVAPPAVHQLLGRRERRTLRWSPSAVVLHAGTRHDQPDTAHHTVSFGDAWQRTFAEIIREGRLMNDPSLLISRPTASDPSLAPDGRELHYILAPCPNLNTAPIAWDAVGPAYRDELLATLRRRGIPGFSGAIEMRRLVTPADWATLGHPAGTPFSAAHTFGQTGPFRPRNLVPGMENVVLAGAGTTPGVGVPSVLISGKLAALRITGQNRSRPLKTRS